MRDIYSKRMKEKYQTFDQTRNCALYALKYVWKQPSGKIYVLTKEISAILNGLLPLVNMIIPGLIINELVTGRVVAKIVLYVVLLLTIPAVQNIINYFLDKKLNKLSLHLNVVFNDEFYHYVLGMDYERIENPEIQVKKDRADDALSGIITVVDQINGLTTAVVSLLAISSVIITLNPFVILLVVVIILSNSVMAKHMNLKKHDLGKKLSAFDWYQGGISYMLNHISFAKEIRIFDIKSLIIGLFTKSKEESNVLELEYRKCNWRLGLFRTATNLIQQGILYAYLVYRVLFKNLPIGNMTIYLSSVGQFSNSLGSVFDSYIKLADRGLKTQELIDFFSLTLSQETVGSKIPKFHDSSVIKFQNVWFQYPGSEHFAIQDLNLEIRAGEKLCIVGSNGSGKSTFIKLLLCLYRPTKGNILLDGVDINEYDKKAYQQLFAPVFQDFVSYYMNLGMNIALTDNYDENKLDDICKESGLDTMISHLPKKYETPLEKWFDSEGVDPSGGEEQRIAIARACYRGGDIFVLDEPTAAIDPITEYDIYMRFNRIITGKCTVLITHRLSAVQLADQVAVFEDGHVVEYGTHRELYTKKGLYTEMFDKQAKFYRDNNEE
ncbi:MAG: ABC transporter ATP-binding protein/permease [Lachnospiraceae bacterium]|nr:ABC transporter ATP-binding protein/permease [Lachnospiraceae bacterium]